MTLEEYTAKRNEYLRKIENYKRKLDKLDEKIFWQMNKDNKFLTKIIVGEEQE